MRIGIHYFRLVGCKHGHYSHPDLPLLLFLFLMNLACLYNILSGEVKWYYEICLILNVTLLIFNLIEKINN